MMLNAARRQAKRCAPVVLRRDDDDVRFEWDDDNVAHIALWNVRPEEAEQAILDPLCIDAASSSMEDEYRDGIIGMTASGRILQVIFTYRDGYIRVLQAKTATRRQQRAYRRQ